MRSPTVTTTLQPLAAPAARAPDRVFTPLGQLIDAALLREAMYAQDCSDCSYGLRRGRSAHDALHQLRERGRHEGLGGIVDADMRGYVESIDRTQRQAIVRRRVNAGRIRRLMGTWGRAGVRKDGVLTHPETGVVQGGGSSPVLAHILLHHVLDDWCERDGRPRLQGRCCLLRFADDCARRKPLDLGDERSPPGDSPDAPQ